MLSAGMFSALASAMIVRRRGFESASPPPARAATEISLMMRVKTRPRLASAAPFLCLIVAHFEWPDMIPYPVRDLACLSPHCTTRACVPAAAGVSRATPRGPKKVEGSLLSLPPIGYENQRGAYENHYSIACQYTVYPVAFGANPYYQHVRGDRHGRKLRRQRIGHVGAAQPADGDHGNGKRGHLFLRHGQQHRPHDQERDHQAGRGQRHGRVFG